jgi:hypothetical protein
MKEGAITKKVNDWRRYKASELYLEDSKFFRSHAFYSAKHYESCGSAALSLLTNIKVETIEKFCPNPKRGWTTSRIIKYLKLKGYTVIELSKGGILSHGYWGDDALTKSHCLLINAHADSEENSLFIMHKNKVYHHFHLQSEDDPLFFFNKPTQDVLLIYHKKWASDFGLGFNIYSHA